MFKNLSKSELLSKKYVLVCYGRVEAILLFKFDINISAKKETQSEKHSLSFFLTIIN